MSQPTEHTWQEFETVSFGNTPSMATELADLVMAGRKTATCSAGVHGTANHVGKIRVLLDGDGCPRAVLETTESFQRRFCDIDESFAFDEGEGDRTLEFWRKEHKRFFEREGNFAPDMQLCCERFRLVRIINL